MTLWLYQGALRRTAAGLGRQQDCGCCEDVEPAQCWAPGEEPDALTWEFLNPTQGTPPPLWGWADCLEECAAGPHTLPKITPCHFGLSLDPCAGTWPVTGYEKTDSLNVTLGITPTGFGRVTATARTHFADVRPDPFDVSHCLAYDTGTDRPVTDPLTQGDFPLDLTLSPFGSGFASCPLGGGYFYSVLQQYHCLYAHAANNWQYTIRLSIASGPAATAAPAAIPIREPCRDRLLSRRSRLARRQAQNLTKSPPDRSPPPQPAAHN